MSVKRIIGRSWETEKKETHQSLAIDDKPDYNPGKRKEGNGDRETYLPLSCNSNKEFHVILNTMFVDGVIKQPRPSKLPSREDRKDPKVLPLPSIRGTSLCCLSNFEKDSL